MGEARGYYLPERFAEVVAKWQHGLLQLDRRNNLLYFRPGKTAVRIVDQTPDGIVKSLLSSRRGLIFDYAESRPRRSSDSRYTRGSVDENEGPEPYVIPGDLRGDCPPLELQRRLSNLRRRHREWEEEQGLNVLFLALGFLEWIDEEGESARAPLLLLPSNLDRASPRDPFTLRQDDDDLTTNATLAVKLKEYGIELPEADLGIETTIEYLDTVRELVTQRPDWRLNEDVYLATFAYSKLAMWRDLEIIKNNGTDHAVVRTMAGAELSVERDSTPSAPTLSLPPDLSGGRLDDVLELRDQFAVLLADFSQLIAINQARSGCNLVIHGPPGTGKSQTIANIIATFLVEGKSVLFVSEKTAALDVVKRRLDEKQLGIFCLDLHSERGRKTNVYQQLQQSVDDRRAIRKLDFNSAALAERRRQLNRVVRALHQVQEPLGYTVFQIHGRFAMLRDVPHVSFDVRDVDRLDQERLASILEVADRVRLRRKEFQEHWTSHWRVLKRGMPSLELADTIRQDMRTVASAVNGMQSTVPELAGALGMRDPDTLGEVTRLEGMARHLAKARGIPQAWMQDGFGKRLRKVVEREAGLQRTRESLLEQLSDAFGSPIPNWDFAALAEQLVVAPAEERSLKRLLGEQWTERLVQGQHATSATLRQLKGALDRLKVIGAEVAEFLGLKTGETWTNLLEIMDIVQIVARVGPVPHKWTDPRGTEVAVAILEKAREVAQQLDGRETRLFSEFEPGVVEVVGHNMLARYRTDHQGRLRRFIGSSYRSDRKTIQAFRRKPEKMSFLQELKVVEEILEVKHQQAAWDNVAAELTPVLQSHYRGRNTEWDSVQQDIHDVEILLKGWTGSTAHVVRLLTEEVSARRSRGLAQEFEQASADVQSLLNTWLATILAQEIQEGKTTLSSLEELIGDSMVIAGRIETAAALSLAQTRQTITDLGSLRELMDSGARLAALELEHAQATDALQADFGVRFKGFDTGWADILACLTWADDLLQMVPPGGFSPQLLTHAEQPQAPSYYETIANSTAEVIWQYHAQTEPLMESYDLDSGRWESWEQANFDDILRWSEVLSQDADSASDWLLYRAAVAELDRSVGPSTTERIRQQTDDSEFVPRIVERRVLGVWLDLIYEQEPVLAGFTASEQEYLIAKFRELDEQLALAAQEEVRKRVFKRYPNIYATTARVGELGILRGELSKRRRQWPVRKLFRNIPLLIQTLKPCFLVSPLAVSQYLPLSDVASETLTFDVVIFDEASQVFPEDAVPAILRGKQLIPAGDQKQLPPSSFWRRSLADDEDDEDDDSPSNGFAGRESILDVAVGMVGRLFHEAHLNVHYRSRDESLIRFSNHHFYGNRLLTFPSPGIRGSWHGVHDVYLPDGRYDAGATRTNRKEAERVAELVFEHMRTRPVGESLGVVALSRPQADLIERLIEERRILERDVDERFNERLDEPFFVKNLENVQGDERDHMIISIGYGPTVGSGAVPNRFGPLNITGGERRLNVVITRARQRMNIVHSLRASDIHSQQEGARLLRRLLEYVASPQQAIEGQITVDGVSESESPFETAVEQSLVAKGYRVARQVGVSGYRIDLAILSDDGTKDLGIECDGATYHSTPAARDRDWLRQKVLEGLGWKIHRVWSTAWVRNPEAELARIEAALAVAQSRTKYSMETRMDTSDTAKESPKPQDPNGTNDPPVVEIEGSMPTEVHLAEYVRAELPSPPPWAELQYETTQNLVRLIVRIAEVEGPVHRDVVIDRIRQRYGMGRVRGSARDHVESAVRIAEREHCVRGDGTFVWIRDDQLCREPRRPFDGNIEHVPPTELRVIVLAAAKVMFGAVSRDLVVETARQLGFARTGGRITEVLDRVVRGLIDEGKLVESFGMLRTID